MGEVEAPDEIPADDVRDWRGNGSAVGVGKE